MTRYRPVAYVDVTMETLTDEGESSGGLQWLSSYALSFSVLRSTFVVLAIFACYAIGSFAPGEVM